MKRVRLFQRLSLYLLIISLLAGTLCSVSLAEKDGQELKNELSGLKQESEQIGAELDYTVSQIEKISSELQKTKEELAKAKGEELIQYESMKTRIKYMYENNTTTLLDVLFSSHSMAEFLSRMSFMTSIAEYDQHALDTLIETQKSIAQKEASLKARQKELSDLQNTLTEKESKLKGQINITSAELAAYNQKIAKAKEKARLEEEKAKEKVEPIIPEREEKPDTPKPPTELRDPVKEITASDVELLAALIECEAGDSHYEGMLAVGSVVVNRMKSRHYPDTLRGVVFQSGQFPPATNGLVENVLNRGIKNSCKQAAEDALAGKNNVGDCVSFRSASSGHAGTIIGDNVFF